MKGYTNMQKLIGDSDMIHWLLFDSGRTPHRIGSDLKISISNLYQIKSGKRSINNLSLESASKLTEYAIKLRGEK